MVLMQTSYYRSGAYDVAKHFEHPRHSWLSCFIASPFIAFFWYVSNESLCTRVFLEYRDFAISFQSGFLFAPRSIVLNRKLKWILVILLLFWMKILYRPVCSICHDNMKNINKTFMIASLVQLIKSQFNISSAQKQLRISSKLISSHLFSLPHSSTYGFNVKIMSLLSAVSSPCQLPLATSIQVNWLPLIQNDKPEKLLGDVGAKVILHSYVFSASSSCGSVVKVWESIWRFKVTSSNLGLVS